MHRDQNILNINVFLTLVGNSVGVASRKGGFLHKNIPVYAACFRWGFLELKDFKKE